MKIGKELIVKIERMNNEGDGVAIYDDFVIFVKDALIGEEVSVKIVDVKKNYAVATIKKIIIPSENRRVPVCPFYKECGGCNLMHIDYEE